MVNTKSLQFDRLKYRKILALIVTVYLFLALFIGYNLLEQVNPDGIAYLHVAREFAQGNFIVRGYWSPLLSWLIAPGIVVGWSPQLSQRILAAVVGLAWILLSVQFARKFDIGRVGKLAVAATMAVLAAYHAFFPISPDLLGATLFLGIVNLISRKSIDRNPVALGVYVGGLGALAYLANAYYFPFFISHMALTALLLLLSGTNWKKIAKFTVPAVLVFSFVSGIWIATLSVRYREPTVSTKGKIVQGFISPGGGKHLCWDVILCDKPIDTLFPWEDPLPMYYPRNFWETLNFDDALKYQVELMAANVNKVFSKIYVNMGILPMLATIMLLFEGIRNWSIRSKRFLFLWIFFTLLLYVFGYMLTFVDSFRYFFPLIPFFVVGIVYIFSQVESKLATVVKSKTSTGAVILIGLLYALPLISYVNPNRLSTMLSQKVNDCLRVDSQSIANFLFPPIAGTDENINYVSYFTNIRTVGAISEFEDPEKVRHELLDLQIMTFVSPEVSDLSSYLIESGSFEFVANHQICGKGYTVVAPIKE